LILRPQPVAYHIRYIREFILVIATEVFPACKAGVFTKKATIKLGQIGQQRLTQVLGRRRHYGGIVRVVDANRQRRPLL
jgi:hypothetical protein